MKHTNHSAVLFIEFVAVIGLMMTELNPNMAGGAGPLRWALLGVLLVCIAIHSRIVLRSRNTLQQIAGELRRAVHGNLTTRLLAKGDPRWNEMIFAVNELIEQLEQVQIEAVQAEAARQSLLSSVSHDIRTPLTSIIGYIDALKDGIAATEEEELNYLNILSSKSSALKKMIDELFTMAKLDANELPHQEEALDLAELTRESVIEFLPRLKAEEIELQANIPEHPCIIEADRISIRRIIDNLIQNAIQYGNTGGILGVTLTESNSHYRLEVWDKGPGILPAELGKVFERSYRGDQARSTASGGSGLGLAIAKALTERSHGTIEADSIPNVRTTFIVLLPKN